jgi:hypothetical protein
MLYDWLNEEPLEHARGVQKFVHVVHGLEHVRTFCLGVHATREYWQVSILWCNSLSLSLFLSLFLSLIIEQGAYTLFTRQRERVKERGRERVKERGREREREISRNDGCLGTF